MSTKKGLGRGLEALFGDVSVDAGTVENSADAIRYIDIHSIAPNKDQPRKEFNKEKIAELADSIREHGVIQPIMVRETGAGYEIVAGERRWRASMEAGLTTVPCLVRELSPEQNMIVALIENIQREDLNAIEEAEALNKMIGTYGMTQEQVSRSIGRSRPYITNSLRLLKLPEAVRDLVSDGTLSAGHAKAILAIEGEDKQVRAARRAAENGWSVRQTELFAGETKGNAAPKKKRKVSKNMEVRRIEEELKQILGTKVNLVFGPRKGRIEIEYYSREELDRLIEILETLGK
ncbi:MAG: ParB/RepB/Spo0J family partition protein [Firmicutes bacterium]|nr:ParB/RepB/Spo0J family partition protein [Bacillota bacterium]